MKKSGFFFCVLLSSFVKCVRCRIFAWKMVCDYIINLDQANANSNKLNVKLRELILFHFTKTKCTILTTLNCTQRHCDCKQKQQSYEKCKHWLETHFPSILSIIMQDPAIRLFEGKPDLALNN